MRKMAIFLISLMVICIGFFSGCNEQDNTQKEETEVEELKINSFFATPTTIYEGDEATLTWIVVNADSVIIDNGIGAVELSGNYIVEPTITTTYKLTATKGSSTKYSSLEIFVKLIKEKLLGIWERADGGLWKFYVNGTSYKVIPDYGNFWVPYDLHENTFAEYLFGTFHYATIEFEGDDKFTLTYSENNNVVVYYRI